MSIQYGPIKAWPGKLREHYQRIPAPFKSSHTGTLELLEKELRMIRAESTVVQLALGEGQFTRDGRPYSQARAQHPGVIVSFMKPVKMATGVQRVPLAFPCDRFTTWESNLRAVALSLEALRMVDRYGVTQNSEQYTGFRSLPPPGPNHESINTVEDAARFIHRYEPGCPLVDLLKVRENYRLAYRRVAAKLHPDAHGGRQMTEWAILQAAKTLLDVHHGL